MLTVAVTLTRLAFSHEAHANAARPEKMGGEGWGQGWLDCKSNFLAAH